MPRDLVVGNGRLLVNFDRNLNIRDLYYPHVGLHNHVSGYQSRIGVWVDGLFSWLDDSWSSRMAYRPGTLTTDACVTNGRLGIGLRFNDTVHQEHNLLLRRVSVENLYQDEREVRLFFHHDFRIYETDIGDTAFFHPFTDAIVHFKRDCYLLVNGRTGEEGIFEYATGVKAFGGAEGTWRDAEDGSLSMHPVEQGSVDSTVSFRLQVPGQGSASLLLWIAVGRSLEEVSGLDAMVAEMPTDALLDECDAYWKSWISRGAGFETQPGLSASDLERLYERSLLVLQTQIDKCGGITAANDTDIMQSARAHYSYVWPRDGALIAHALDLAGYAEPSRRFLSFCAALLPENRPYFLQKYSPDGTPGATWHPWIADGEPEIPCQQDSTALVVWAAGKHFDRWKDKDYLAPIYRDMVVPAVDHMIMRMDPFTGLPRPSYDLWEQDRGVHLWTCCTVFGALSAAVKLAMAFDKSFVDEYRRARMSLKSAILKHFYDPHLDRFVRSLSPGEKPGELHRDLKIDASMAAIFLFELLPADDPKVASTMQAIYERLWVRSPVGGLARFEDDGYFQVSSDLANVPGNPWFVTTLWMAEWYIATAQGVRDLEPALDLLHWAASHASEAGLMSEQLHPYTGKPLAVMPLSWSHAAFITAMHRCQEKVRLLAVGSR